MSNFVRHLLVSSVYTDVGSYDPPSSQMAWQMRFLFSVVSDETENEVYHLEILSRKWRDLEEELARRDHEICNKLVELFPEHTRRISKEYRVEHHPTRTVHTGNYTLFDEYTNMYFSNLMNVLSRLPQI